MSLIAQIQDQIREASLRRMSSSSQSQRTMKKVALLFRPMGPEALPDNVWDKL